MNRCGRINLLSAIVLPIFLSACTVVYLPENTLAVRMDTMNVVGAFCRGEGRNERVYNWRRTPEVIAVPKDAFPLIVTCEKPGFRKTVSIVEGQEHKSPPPENFKESVRSAVNSFTNTFREEPVESNEPLHVRVSMEPEPLSPGEPRREYRIKKLPRQDACLSKTYRMAIFSG